MFKRNSKYIKFIYLVLIFVSVVFGESSTYLRTIVPFICVILGFFILILNIYFLKQLTFIFINSQLSLVNLLVIIYLTKYYSSISELLNSYATIDLSDIMSSSKIIYLTYTIKLEHSFIILSYLFGFLLLLFHKGKNTLMSRIVFINIFFFIILIIVSLFLSVQLTNIIEY
ncbi:MAG: hypothetical protein D8M61_15045 [Ignavibacteriae bacterium]|nr:hypothetical protein [Ignavibacteriota bacterium]